MSLTSQWRGVRWSLLSEKKKQKLLDDACRLLRLWPETAGLLDLAAQRGIGIRFDDALASTDTDGYLHRNRATGESFIALKPCLSPGDIAIPLIHELRHLWQEQRLGLSPQDAARAEPDAQTALTFMRAKEADAFAFTNLMISRINHAREDLAAAGSRDGDAREEFLSSRIVARLPTEKAKMEQDFLRELQSLDSYDSEALRVYHRRYVEAPGPPRDHAKNNLALADLRNILIAGTMEGMPPYLDALDDRSLAEKILIGAKPAVREAASLIEAFEKSAARGASAEAQRAAIAAKVLKLH